ncbi:hypothetical protein MKW94_014364 [Papaver nudicaule]|uniref:Uncharacterized protein n=1 Tax=Papaver nudicaule TaxID=74823 RepID=A0AA41V083_PAPNU|nr:hypothetical protein [Papaver nudicaule]MCL7038231.1 hypothetical protein [Papaver nudicaule]
MAIYSEHRAILGNTRHAHKKHTREFPGWFESKADDDNFVWGRTDVPEETVNYVAPERSRRENDDEDGTDVESVYTDSDVEESDDEIDCD